MSVVACIMHFEWVVVSELRQEEMKKKQKTKMERAIGGGKKSVV